MAKSKPTAMNLAVTVSTSSSSVNSPIASKSTEILKASSRQIGCSVKPDVRSKRNSNPDASSSSQGWQKDALLDVCTGKPVATGKDQESLNFPEPICSPRLRRVSRKPGNSRNFRRLGNRRQNFATQSPYFNKLCVLRMEKVFSIVRQRYGLSPMDQLKNLDVNTAIWVYSCLPLFKLQFILVKNIGKSSIYKNQPKTSLRQLFQVTQRLITDQTEITGLTTIDRQQLMWRETTLL